MKPIDKQKFRNAIKEAQVSLKVSYRGKDGNFALYVDWNGKNVLPSHLSDEQALLLFQLSGKMCSELAKEPIKRGLLPDSIAKHFANADAKKNS